ncbi:MAG: acyl-CoA dehydrogenase [Bacteroidota bacterium]
MSTNPPSIGDYSPGILSLLPMIYVAWADQVLSPSEVRVLQHKVSQLASLTADDLELIQKWTNPQSPPSRELFQNWRIILSGYAAQLPTAQRISLAALGLEMAKSVSGQATTWTEKNVKSSLEELEEALGLVREETYKSLFPEPLPSLVPEEPIHLDIQKLRKHLDAPHEDLRERVRSLLSDPVFQVGILRDKKDYRDQVLQWTKLLAKQGYGAISYPEAQGGKDDIGAYTTIFEMLGFHDLSLTIKFGVQFGLFGGSILALGSRKHHEKYLAQVGKLDLAGCFAMTETGHGSNVRQLETTAIYEPETKEFIIHSPHRNAGTEYIGNALHSRMATVFAQLIVRGENQGIHALLVPLRNENHQLLPGVTVEDNGYKLGLNGVDNGRIWFNQVRVPRENLLDRFAQVDEDGTYQSPIENPSKRFFTMLGTLVGGRVAVPRAGLSAAKKGLLVATRYALKRRQFGKDFKSPETLLLDYPSHQRRLLPLIAKSYALDAALTYLTHRFVHRDESEMREIETLAAGLKSYSTWFTTKALQECREACGGKGYLWENEFADLKADSDIFTTFEGDNTVLMQLVARGRLSAFQNEFNEDGMVGLLRYVSARFITPGALQNSLSFASTNPEHLRDPKFHVNAFEYREQRLLMGVAERLRGKIKGGMDSYKAFLECQTHLLKLAEAYIERVVLEKFLDSNAQADPEIVPKLEQLAQLYALNAIETDKGWFLETGFISADKSKAIRREVDRLCAEVRVFAGNLVEGFGIPEVLIKAPIAKH